MIVVGLTGKAGAGKSTVADYLVEAHGFIRLSFAAPLKKMLRTLNPIVGNVRGFDYPVLLNDVFEGYGGDEHTIKASRYGAEYRRLLQVLGTDCIRAVDEDFWVKAAMKQLTDPAGRYVFDDVRFPNESDAIMNATRRGNMTVWYVERPGHDAGAGTHASEQHAGHMNEAHTLFNLGTVEDLQGQADYQLQYNLGLGLNPVGVPV